MQKSILKLKIKLYDPIFEHFANDCQYSYNTSVELIPS